MSTDTGGPAFPRPASLDEAFSARCQSQTGMTLRDYFAAKAMVGLVVTDPRETSAADEIAKDAYELADAMLAERDK